MVDEELMKYSRELEEDLDGAIYHPDPDHKSETGKNWAGCMKRESNEKVPKLVIKMPHWKKNN